MHDGDLRPRRANLKTRTSNMKYENYGCEVLNISEFSRDTSKSNDRRSDDKDNLVNIKDSAMAR